MQHVPTDAKSANSDPSDLRVRSLDFRFLRQRSWLALTALVVLLIPSFWQLSSWQFHRLDQRRAHNAEIAAAAAQPAQPLEEVLRTQVSVADWTPVVVSGRWLPATAMARRHWRDDILGFWAVSALRSEFGDVLVVRGWLPTTKSAATTPADPGRPAPGSPVTIRGWLVKTESGNDPSTLPRGQIAAVGVRNFEKSTGIALAPASPRYLVVVDHARTSRQQFATAAGLYDIQPPNLGDGPHHSYAWQWRAFIVLVIVGWTRLVLAEAREQRIQQGQTASAP